MSLDKILSIIFVLLIPLVLLIVTVIYLARIRNLRDSSNNFVHKIEGDLSDFLSVDIKNANELSIIFTNGSYPNKFKEQWNRISSSAKSFYKSRWFPPLEDYLGINELEPEQSLNLLSYQPAILLLSIGLLSSVVIFVYLMASDSTIFPGLALVPAVVGILVGLFMYNSSHELRQTKEHNYKRMHAAIAKTVPVYTHHNGVALLVDEMLTHESNLQTSINRFTENSQKMAEADFADGICRSVKTIMSEELTPPIIKASEVLSELAENLDRRQMTGMENLSNEFSSQLASNLSEHLAPLNSELVSFNRLIGRTKDFIADSVTVLNTNREQNIALNNEITESLKLMTIAKNDLANEMSSISQNIDIIRETSSKMARTYSGEEDALSDKIKDLASSMREATQVFTRGLKTSSDSLELAGKLKVQQEKQYDEFSLQINSIIANLEELDSSIRDSTQNFTKESSVYVNETLKSFDEGLAEVVERLIFTASSLRDAVDSLPAALKRSGRKDF